VAPQAADFAAKLEQLQGMGFSLALAAGGLARAGGDADEAADACIAAS
jgi:hypothetical protein